MKARQRGSVLAGTLVLSIVVASGAAGLMVIAGSLESGTSGSDARRILGRRAESGLQLGAYWVRQNVPSLAGLPASTPVSNGPVTLDGARVQVTLEQAPGGGGNYDLVSWAELTPCTERITLRWRISAIAGGAAPYTITLTDWSETIGSCGP